MIPLICVLFLCVLSQTNPLVIPQQDVNSKRVHQNQLSNEAHYDPDSLHNADYDHEAFLGEKEAKRFDELPSEESKRRLGIIVDRIDTDKNGFVSFEELKDWIQQTQKRYIEDDVEQQWKNVNPEEDNEITWKKYKKSTFGYIDESESNETSQYKDMLDRDWRRWERADQDHNGSLDKKEFTDFIHPEESQHMQDIVVIETIEDIDKDKDGKISLDEYIGDVYNEDNDIDEEPHWVQTEREQFRDLRDKDRTGFMEFEEVKHWILPDEYDNSDSEAKHLIYESDFNRDNQLTKEEILNKFDLFVGSQATDFGQALEKHDEF